jgi:hypothetical protein
MQHFLKDFDNLLMQKMVRSSMEWTSSAHSQPVQSEEKIGLGGLLNCKPENLILRPEISQPPPPLPFSQEHHLSYLPDVQAATAQQHPEIHLKTTLIYRGSRSSLGQASALLRPKNQGLNTRMRGIVARLELKSSWDPRMENDGGDLS